MEDPFYRGFWTSRSGGSRMSPPSAAKPSRPPKVVSIPVRFVDSDEKQRPQQFPVSAVDARRAASALPSRDVRSPSRSNRSSPRVTAAAAAVEIQRVVRGYLVRKNMGAVRRVEDEIDALEKEVERQGDRLRRDARERLRVSELLMSLLFRLDLVRGVRDYRRRVIRRTIALQEAVDASAATEAANGEAAAQGVDGAHQSKAEAPKGIPQALAPTTTEIPRSMELDQELLENSGAGPNTAIGDGEGKGDEEDPAGFGVADNAAMEEDPATSFQVVLEAMGESTDPDEEKLPGSAEKHSGNEAVKAEENGDTVRLPVKSAASGEIAEAAEVGRRGGRYVDGVVDEAMEKMVEDNKRLKGLVVELCERNEAQLRLMDGLLRRVEQLENAVEKMRGKKRRQAAGEGNLVPRNMTGGCGAEENKTKENVFSCTEFLNKLKIKELSQRDFKYLNC